MHIDRLDTVTLRAPGRLHLGFLDPSASLGRRFGSIGMVIDGFETEVELSAAFADRVTADTPEGDAQMERASAYLRTLRARSGRADTLHLRLLRVLPAHEGFGSGTQLALAIARAFAQWHRMDVSTATLAYWLGRGARSGIGIHGFDLGGLLVDGGPAADGRPAPLLSRLALPDPWRIVVVQDERVRGLAGNDEKGALAVLDAMPAARAAEICHEVLMRVLPGAASGEFDVFALGVSRVQQVLGEYFAPVQHGRAYTSAAVGRLMDWIARSAHRAAIGQSSWGPTGFAIVESPAHAQALESAARAAGLIEPGLALRIVTPRNRGAEIIDLRAMRRAVR
ncbi:MAG TPA: beta-ribofuranosylaminobenzene 5'-phosphate synthase family protein [Burkholderiaceae bacterium]|nr:beta-ribofuranosylaminobenzene 5'-phosphate synthase family protein [Burkholderiaceae bacterium]